MAKKRARTTPAAISAKLVEAMQDAREKRLELQRQVDALKRSEETIKGRLIAHVEAKGGRRRSTTLGRFRLSLKPGKKYVRWKDEYISEMGTEAAEQVLDRTKPKDKLEIEAN